ATGHGDAVVSDEVQRRSAETPQRLQRSRPRRLCGQLRGDVGAAPGDETSPVLRSRSGQAHSVAFGGGQRAQRAITVGPANELGLTERLPARGDLAGDPLDTADAVRAGSVIDVDN